MRSRAQRGHPALAHVWKSSLRPALGDSYGGPMFLLAKIALAATAGLFILALL